MSAKVPADFLAPLHRIRDGPVGLLGQVPQDVDFLLRLLHDLVHRGVRVVRQPLVVRLGVVHHLEVGFALLGQGLVRPLDDGLVGAVLLLDPLLRGSPDHFQPLVLRVAEILFHLTDALDDPGVGEVEGGIGRQPHQQTVDGKTQGTEPQGRQPGAHRHRAHCHGETAEGGHGRTQHGHQRLDGRADGIRAADKAQELIDRLDNRGPQVRRQEGLQLVHLRERLLRVAVDEQLVLLVEGGHRHFVEVLQGVRRPLAVVVRLAQGTADRPHVGDQLGEGRHVLVRALAQLEQRPFQAQGRDHLRPGLEAQARAVPSASPATA